MQLGLQEDGSFIQDIKVGDRATDLGSSIERDGFAFYYAPDAVIKQTADFRCDLLPHPDDDDEGFSAVRMHWIPLNDAALLWLQLNAPVQEAP